MNTQELVDQMIKSKKLRNNHEIEKYEQSIEQLINHNKLEELYLGFDDNAEDDEVMFGLVHAIESFYEEVGEEEYFFIFINQIKMIYRESKEWIKLMTVRILNDIESRNEFIKIFQKSKQEDKDFIINLMKDIELDNIEHLKDLTSKFTN